MPIQYLPRADMFQQVAYTLVNTVNCVGIMGKGVALGFKQRWPRMIPQYKQMCRDGTITPGSCTIVRLRVRMDEDLTGLFLATKNHWIDPSRIEWIDSALASMSEIINENTGRFGTIAMPWPGCGNGGLERRHVKPLLEKHLESYPYTIKVCG